MDENVDRLTERSTTTVDMTDNCCSMFSGADQIKKELTELLALDALEEREATEILRAVLQKGRQMLHSYQEDIIGDIYDQQIKNDSKLLQILKKYHELEWKVQYEEKFPWFRSLCEETRTETEELFDSVLARTAEYGDKYMKDCPLLSITVQLLFESLNDDEMPTIFDNIWYSLTNDGLQSVTMYSDYILPEIMEKQLEKAQNQTPNGPLFMALREFYRDQLFQLLNYSKIVNRANLYEQALDFVAEHGWRTGVTMIEKKTTKKNFNILIDLTEKLMGSKSKSLTSSSTPQLGNYRCSQMTGGRE